MKELFLQISNRQDLTQEQVQEVFGQSLPQEELEQGGGHLLAALRAGRLLNE